MMSRCAVVLLLGVVSTSAWANDDPAASADEAAIRKVLDDQVAAWNKGDLAGFMKGYWKSKELTFYSGKDKKLGWDQAYERYQKRYQADGKEMGRLGFAELEIQVITPQYAIVKGRWKVEMKNETLEGLFTLVMKKFEP